LATSIAFDATISMGRSAELPSNLFRREGIPGARDGGVEEPAVFPAEEEK
jgi:hypothetical protein